MDAQRLFGLLDLDPALAASGHRCCLGAPGDVLIKRGSHLRGVWRCHGNEYLWYEAGRNEPSFRAPDAASAAAETQRLLAAT